MNLEYYDTPYDTPMPPRRRKNYKATAQNSRVRVPFPCFVGGPLAPIMRLGKDSERLTVSTSIRNAPG
jgi:hypothetical protein